MTECTGKRYWRKRIIEAKERYNAWVSCRHPRHLPPAQQMLADRWYAARIDWFNDQRDRLYSTARRDRTAYLNGIAKDRRS